jgi:hypothetical protein
MWHSIMCHDSSYVWDLVPAHLVIMFAPGLWTPKTRVWQWHNSRNGASDAVFLSGRSGKGWSDCGHFDLADWGTCVRIRCQTILALNAPAVRSVGEAICPRLLLDEACPSWASGVPRVRPLPEEALGRDVTSSGTTVPARGWARARRDRAPLVDEALTWTAPISLCGLCWWWLPAVFRSVGGTPNYGTQHNLTYKNPYKQNLPNILKHSPHNLLPFGCTTHLDL